tara:strand:+ start:1178 stop:1528 length:351 start_codon:yes stop_codon:yes gene_type:complete
MKHFENFIISHSSSIIDAIEKIQLYKTRDLLVSKKGKIIGTVSEGDILRSVLEKKDLNNNIEDIANYNFKFVTKKNIKDVKKIFKKERVFIVPVFDKNFKLVDIITLKDFFKLNVS